MIKITLSEFALENIQTLTPKTRERVMALIQQLEQGGLSNVNAQKILNAPSNAYAVRSGEDVQLTVILIDEENLIVDDVFIRGVKKSNMTGNSHVPSNKNNAKK